MAILFGLLPGASAPEIALLVAAVFAGLSALVSLGRAQFETAALVVEPAKMS